MQSAAPKAIYPDLRGRHVAITGGATGIGAALVAGFAGQGSRVTFLDIDEGAAAKLLASMPAAQVAFVRCDVTKTTDLQDALVAAGRGMPISVLVNNAARDDRHTAEALTAEGWRDLLAVNLDHHFFAAQAVAGAMTAAGGGTILNFGSISAVVGLGGMPAYVAAKGAIDALSRALARDLGPANIRVNTIVPGFVRTERQMTKWMSPELEQAVMAAQCLKRFIEPEYVANLAVFLASDVAVCCTGRSYFVDAGWL